MFPLCSPYAPGEYWCYNNWDFNALVTILEQETGTKVFEEFERVFAQPLGMQDFRVRDGYYHYELEKSEHPAYPFRLSARDMARFGLLYLNEGEWNGQRVLSEEWVEQSRHPHSEEAWGSAYGYMWWISRTPLLDELGSYSARGVGGQTIQVLPGAGMVLVNRTNTFDDLNVNRQQLDELAILVLDARIDEPMPDPKLVPLPDDPEPTAIALPAELEERVCREWPNGLRGSPVHVFPYEEGGLGLRVVAVGDMLLDVWPLSYSEESVQLMVERAERVFYVELDPDDLAKDTMVNEKALNLAGYEHLTAGRVEAALEQFERCCRYYPGSANAWDSLGEAQMAHGDLDASIASYTRSLELDPGNRNARDRIERLEKERKSHE